MNNYALMFEDESQETRVFSGPISTLCNIDFAQMRNNYSLCKLFVTLGGELVQGGPSYTMWDGEYRLTGFDALLLLKSMYIVDDSLAISDLVDLFVAIIRACDVYYSPYPKWETYIYGAGNGNIRTDGELNVQKCMHFVKEPKAIYVQLHSSPESSARFRVYGGEDYELDSINCAEAMVYYENVCLGSSEKSVRILNSITEYVRNTVGEGMRLPLYVEMDKPGWYVAFIYADGTVARAINPAPGFSIPSGNSDIDMAVLYIISPNKTLDRAAFTIYDSSLDDDALRPTEVEDAMYAYSKAGGNDEEIVMATRDNGGCILDVIRKNNAD